MHDLLLDLRSAVRGLSRRPLFTILAILALAVGFAAVATVFGVADLLLLRPPLADDPARIAHLHSVDPDGSSFHAFSWPDFEDLEASDEIFEAVGAWSTTLVSLAVPPEEGGEASLPRPASAQVVGGGFFEVFGVAPASGRFFRPDETRPGSGAPVVVIGPELRDAHPGLDVGATLRVNGVAMTVVGVTPEGFTGPMGVVSTEVWVPFGQLEVAKPGLGVEARNRSWLEAIGRLRDGVEPREALAFLRVLQARWAEDHPEVHPAEGGIDLTSLGALPSQARAPVASFVGALGFVALLILGITGINVTGLLLARAAERRHETVVRVALGAGSRVLFRQWAVEAALLFGSGGVLGLLVAHWIATLLPALLPPLPLSLAVEPGVDGRTVVLALGLSLVCSLVFAVSPGRQAARLDLSSALRRDPLRGGSGGRQGLRSGLIVVQVAGALFLSTTAVLLLVSLREARAIDPGFRVDGVDVAQLDLGVRGLEEAEGLDFFRRLRERLEAVPGVASAGLVRMPHLGMGNSTAVVAVPGRGAEEEERLVQADQNTISVGALETLGIPILRGRSFGEADRLADGEGEIVTVVNRTFAERFWPEDDPIGQRIRLGGPEAPWATVVGVAADAKYRSLGEDPRPYLYFPLAQDYSARMWVLVRGEDGAELDGGLLRTVVAEMDPALPVLLQTSLGEQIGVALLPRRIASALTGSFSVLGLVLVALGVYGVTACAVERRRREVGIRRALGARRGRILVDVIGRSLRLGMFGCALGLLATLAARPLLSGLVVGSGGSETALLTGAVGLLLATVGLGSLLPALRACRVDPAIVLREE